MVLNYINLPTHGTQWLKINELDPAGYIAKNYIINFHYAIEFHFGGGLGLVGKSRWPWCANSLAFNPQYLQIGHRRSCQQPSRATSN